MVVPVLVSVTAIRPLRSAIGTVSNVAATLYEALSLVLPPAARTKLVVLAEITDGDGDGDGDGEEDADGDPEEAADGVAWLPATNWPAGIAAEPVTAWTPVPTGSDARSGAGAAWPATPPLGLPARVTDAGT